ncbi:stage III sporulation protein AF [Pseudoflavonifractor sp. MSJ-37]|uniref:stage III sporulation protein AF n=1 Tax=Pseudoflavonifractor sp. MSJ-37 TaxID=2841531 RepID=UPI001C11107E|nr:stage III sporulation protein AF [Pseudoflavonifractor sp. MSJ-37]MBU5434869.1 stage III sporulation protein AF [Pseudoflavonifractor sp. MSJ-37]
MLAWIQRWLMGVTAASVLAAAAESLMPPGTIRRLGKLTGGLVLLLAVLSPIGQIDEDALARALAETRLRTSDQAVEALSQTDSQLLTEIIAEESQAYISDKAADLGIDCAVRVEVRVREDGYPVPWAVTIRGELTDVERQDLSRRISADFAIPEERQSYQPEEEAA